MITVRVAVFCIRINVQLANELLLEVQLVTLQINTCPVMCSQTQTPLISGDTGADTLLQAAGDCREDKNIHA